MNGSVQSLQELQDIKIKLAALEGIMGEQGIDAAALFKEAGLDEDEKSLSRIKDTSRARIDPQTTDEQSVGSAGQSTMSSGRRSSGVSSTRRSFGGERSNRNLQPVMEVSSNGEEPMKIRSCPDEPNKAVAPETSKPSAVEPTRGTGSGSLNEEVSNTASAPAVEPSEMSPDTPPPPP
jgi:hypothetical protein